MESIGKYLRHPTPTSTSEPPKVARPYPDIIEAVVLILLLCVVELVVASIAGGWKPNAALESPRFAFCNLIAFGIVIAYGLRRAKTPSSKVFPLIRVRSSLYFPIALCLIGMWAITLNVEHFIYIVDPPPVFVRCLLPDLLRTGGYWNAFFQLAVVAPLTEEFLFRGLILHGFLKRYNTVTAIVASAVLFGVVHIDLWQVSFATLAGLLLGWWAVETQSLLPCLFGHAFWNSFFIILYMVPHQGPSTRLAKMLKIAGFAPPWFVLAGAGVFGVGILMLARRFQDKVVPAAANAVV